MPSMAILNVAVFLSLLLLTHNVAGLQVTADSPCSSLCLGKPGDDPSDPNISQTFGSEIACLDDSFSTSSVGQKFKACVSCLQTSTTSKDEDYNDQEWFIYNLRFALGSCLFGFENATDTTNSSCSTPNTCGPLRNAIEDGNFDPTNKDQYSYCHADQNAILGSDLPKCIQCLRDGNEQVFLSNFLIALKAGCVQQPPAGTPIGLDGTVFSKLQANITSNADIPTASHHGASPLVARKSVIGLSVGLGILVLITLATMCVCYRKRKEFKATKALRSPLDSRFGAINITSPSNGAYGNPYSSPPVNVREQFDMSTLSAKERAVLAGRNIKALPTQAVAEPQEWQEGSSYHKERDSQPPLYTPQSLPKHQAYNENTRRSSSGYEPSQHSSKSSPSYPPSRTSPRYPPPSHTSPKHSPPATFPSTSMQAARPAPPPPVITTPINFSKPTRILSRKHGLGYTAPSNAVGIRATQDSQTLVNISSPIFAHGNRFDFQIAEKERLQREKEEQELSKNGKSRGSPDSMESEEQWPGNY